MHRGWVSGMFYMTGNTRLVNPFSYGLIISIQIQRVDAIECVVDFPQYLIRAYSF